MNKITLKEAWNILIKNESSLIGVGHATLTELEKKLKAFHGDTYKNARQVIKHSTTRMQFSNGSYLYRTEFNEAYKFSDYLILKNDNKIMIYQTY